MPENPHKKYCYGSRNLFIKKVISEQVENSGFEMKKRNEGCLIGSGQEVFIWRKEGGWMEFGEQISGKRCDR